MHQLALDIMSCVPTESAYNRLVYLKKQVPEALSGVNPAAFTDAKSYLEASQEAALVRKMPDLFKGQRKHLREKAVTVFYECEEICRRTNARLAWWDNYLTHPWDEVGETEENARIAGWIRKARKLASKMLGPLPTSLTPKFSSGSSFLNRAKQSTLPHKLGGRCAVTQALSDVFPKIIEGTLWEDLVWHYGREIVRGNRFSTVPKDSEKDRGICVEPLGNLGLQLSAGDYIRARLRMFSIDIANKDHSPFKGQNLHRLMAKFASIDNDFATIDLSNASDTVSWFLVKLILPGDWFSLLNMLRSPETEIDGEWIKLHKFSSMGNGFTFELETLLFYIICVVTSGHSVITVYGDDMILPSENYDDVVAALKFFGFTVNTKKSFKDGPFRESCGGDYWLGESVRPIFLKTSPSNPTEWVELQNRLYEVSEIHNWDMAIPIENIVSSVPYWARVWGPPGTPGCFWTRDESRWRVKSVDGMRFVRVLKSMPLLFTSWRNKKEALACAILGTPFIGAAHRGQFAGWRRSWYSIS